MSVTGDVASIWMVLGCDAKICSWSVILLDITVEPVTSKDWVYQVARLFHVTACLRAGTHLANIRFCLKPLTSKTIEKTSILEVILLTYGPTRKDHHRAPRPHHSIDQAREQLGFVARPLAVRRLHALQVDSKPGRELGEVVDQLVVAEARLLEVELVRHAHAAPRAVQRVRLAAHAHQHQPARRAPERRARRVAEAHDQRVVAARAVLGVARAAGEVGEVQANAEIECSGDTQNLRGDASGRRRLGVW